MAKNSSPKADQGESAQLYEPARFDSGSIVFNRRSSEKTEKEKLAKIEKDAFEKGYVEGIKSGSQTISATSKRLDSVIRELESFRDKKTKELVPDIIDLSIAIAKKIIHSNIEKNRENVITITREALSKLGGKEEKILIRVNPDDYDTMLSNLDSLRGEMRLMDITIEPSEVITPGGCFIETPSGEVDARIEEMIKEIGDAIATASNI